MRRERVFLASNICEHKSIFRIGETGHLSEKQLKKDGQILVWKWSVTHLRCKNSFKRKKSSCGQKSRWEQVGVMGGAPARRGACHLYGFCP